MKYFNVLFFVLISIVSFTACNSSSNDAEKKAARESLMVPESPSTPTATPPTKAPEPAQNAAGVWHYTCEKGCAGGGGSAGTCAICGGALAHNQAYHAGNTPTPTTPGATTPPPVTPTPEPAQNAAGVWHYTCGNGCEGGAGSAVACGKCGTTLAHNSAYH